EGKLTEAAAELRSAIQVRPDFAPAHYTLSAVLRQSGDLEGSLAALQNVLRLRQESDSTYQALGMSLRQKGDIAGAAKAFQKAEALKRVRITFQAATALLSTGTRLLREGDTSGAVAKFGMAIKLAPNFAPAHYQLGLAFRAKNDHARAIAEFDKVLQLD